MNDLHDRIVRTQGKLLLRQGVYSPLDFEVLTTILDAIELWYRPTDKEDQVRRSKELATMEEQAFRVAAAAVEYFNHERDAHHERDSHGPLWVKLRGEVDAYLEMIEEYDSE